MTAVITINQLTRCLKEAGALDQLSPEVRAGAIFGFLGHNGAGKIALMRLLAPITDAAAPETTDALGILTVNRIPFSLTCPVTSGTALRDSIEYPLV